MPPITTPLNVGDTCYEGFEIQGECQNSYCDIFGQLRVRGYEEVKFGASCSSSEECASNFCEDGQCATGAFCDGRVVNMRSLNGVTNLLSSVSLAVLREVEQSNAPLPAPKARIQTRLCRWRVLKMMSLAPMDELQANEDECSFELLFEYLTGLLNLAVQFRFPKTHVTLLQV